MAAEGMKITLSALSGGRTVDKHGKRLLTAPFVFQCPPMNSFPLTRAFTMNNYDTITNEQYSTLISRQLKTLPIDTLVMELGVKPGESRPTRTSWTPSWVPYPTFNGGRVATPVSPQWYVEQLDLLVNSGAPFKLVAAFPNTALAGFAQTQAQAGPIASFDAQLTSFQEVYNAGEGDAVYLTAVTFAEWKDQNQSERALGSSGTTVKLPTNVLLHADGSAHLDNPTNVFANATLVMLSKFFYHDTMEWQRIAKENQITGIGQNDQIINAPKFKDLSGSRTAKIKIPDVERRIAAATAVSSGT